VRHCYTITVPATIVRLDCSAESVLAVCAVCGWRDGPTSKHTARVLAAAHRAAEHPAQARSWAVRLTAAVV